MGKRSPSSSSSFYTHGDMESATQCPVRPPQHFGPPLHEPWFPWLVPFFFFSNITAFIFTMYVNDCPSTTDSCVLPFLGRFSFQPLSQNPLFGPSTTTLIKMGGLEWKLVVKEGEGWRLISCMWLHAGVVHLLANMMSLLFIGIRLEQEFGFLRIGLLFVISGIGGTLLSSLNLKSTVSVGSSGALFGLLGAMLSELFTNWTIYANKFAALLTLIFVIALNLAIGILPHVDSSAHIGGFLSGFLLGFILLIRPQFGWISRKSIPPGYDLKFVKPKYKCYQYLLWVTALVILTIGCLGKAIQRALTETLILRSYTVATCWSGCCFIIHPYFLRVAGVSSIWLGLKGRKTKFKHLEAFMDYQYGGCGDDWKTVLTVDLTR